MNRNCKKVLPFGWTYRKLCELGEFFQGDTPSTEVADYWDGTYPFITGADIKNLYVGEGRSTVTDKGLNSSKTHKCEKDEVLIVSRTRVGRIGIASTVLAVSQDVTALRLHNGTDPKYLALYLKSISDQLEDACQGATIKGVTRGFLDNILVPFPPTIEEQISIANEIEANLAEVEAMRQAVAKQVEAIEATPSAILRAVFDFDLK